MHGPKNKTKKINIGTSSGSAHILLRFNMA